jgi:hypothetical protein
MGLTMLIGTTSGIINVFLNMVINFGNSISIENVRYICLAMFLIYQFII